MANCVEQPNGVTCDTGSNYSSCKPWDISAQTRTNCYADSLIQESLEIAGAQVNVHKMLGIHEQTKLLDLTGTGEAISGGAANNFPASNAFTTFKQVWKSKQSGLSPITTSSYIGYDFGQIKLPNGRQRYGVDAPERRHITTIKIKQGAESVNRVTKVRVERSNDGSSWYGVTIIMLPDNDQLNTISFKQSVPSRFWRLRPLDFKGGSCDSWIVQALELHDYAATTLNNIQDMVLLENRDRDYQIEAITIKGYYEQIQTFMDFSVFGSGGAGSNAITYNIKVNFNSTVTKLGRPVVIGDIIELPSEAQYTPDLRKVPRFLEVTDVTWDPGSYTPGWMPTMLLVTAKQAIASQETRDIFGDLDAKVDSSGLFDNDDGNNPMYQDYSAIDQAIAAEAKTAVPERGAEGSNTVREFEQQMLDDNQENFPHLRRLGFNRTGLYVEDAMPQNGEPYTEGPEYPTSPNDGDYHRLTYEGLAKDVPARLYRYSTTKQRWIYLETDRRAQYNNQKVSLEEYTTSATKIPPSEIK